jgi:hypothetical protein
MSKDDCKRAPYKFDRHKGLLFAALDRPVFEKVVKLIQQEKNEEIAKLPTDTIFHIYAGDASQDLSKPLPYYYSKDRLTLLACAFVCIVFGGVFGMGILALGELLRSSG